MNPIEIALKLDFDLTEDEANELASKIMQSKDIDRPAIVRDVATALWNIAQWRYSGVGFSKEVSNVISKWVENNFSENEAYVDRLIDVIYELNSNESDDMVRRLYQLTENDNLKGNLLEALAYKGT